MEDIPCFNYESIPLEQKYQWMRSGPGGAASIGFGDGLARLADDFNAADANIGQKLLRRGLAAEWQGQAATAADGALNRAAAVVAANAAPGNAGRDSAHRYGDSFEAAKNAIPPPPSVGQNSWWGSRADELGTALDDTFGSTFGVQSDYAKRLAAHQAADQAANDALRHHESTTRTVLAAYQSAITGQPAARATGAPPAGIAPGANGGPGSSGSSRSAGSPTTGPASVTPLAPGGFTPLAPAGGGSAGLVPGSGGGFVPAGPAPSPTATPPPVPVGGSRSGGPAPSGRVPSGGGGTGGVPGGGGVPPGPGGASAAGGGAWPEGRAPAGAGGTSAPGGAWPGGREGTGGAWPGGAGSAGPRAASPGGGIPPGGGVHSLAARGGAGLVNDSFPRAPSGGLPGAGALPVERGTGPGGFPLGGLGGIGGQRLEHRNTVFIPDDEPFRVELDDLTPPVIGLPGDQ